MLPRPRFWVSWFLLIGVLVPRGVFGFRGAWATARVEGDETENVHTFSCLCTFLTILSSLSTLAACSGGKGLSNYLVIFQK